MIDSGIEWLGGIPAHWRVLQTRRLCELTTGGRDTQDADPDGAYPFFVRSQSVERIGTFSFDGEGVLTSGDGAGVGKIFHHHVGRLEFHQRVYLYYSFRHVIGRFFFYYLRETLQHVVLAGNAKSTVDSLRRPMLQEFPIAVPPLDEQRAIVTFLDRKTAEIDGLLEKKERLVELLREKRLAVITQAVTKGLDPARPTKDSGIAAVGGVPAHWKVDRSKVFWREVGARSTSGAEELLTVSHITGVTPRSEKSEVNMFLAESMEGYKQVSVDDLAINTMWAWMGALGVSPVAGIVSPSYNVYRLRRPHEHYPPYFDLLYRTPPYIAEINRWSKGIWSSRLRLYPQEFFSMMTLAPPREEQERIVAHVRSVLADDERVLSVFARSIETLREYRQALITAAVTGKIDVSKREA
jgi:type I restriction enzyme S subunit